MAYRTLELTLISAQDLKKVALFSQMKVYALVWISTDPRSRRRTPKDRDGGRNPTWNITLRFTVPAEDPNGVAILHIRLLAARLLGDGNVGEVLVPLRDLLADAGNEATNTKFLSYQVRRPSRKPKGVLNFSYKLGEVIAVPTAAPPPTAANSYPPATSKGHEPVTAYPAAYPPPYGAAGPYAAGYPPAPYGYGNPGPGYGYGNPVPGYGYGAAMAPPARGNNRFGMGMGAGLLGGALGGLLIGDMISDAAAYDAGYDAGFGDAGDFGF